MMMKKVVARIKDDPHGTGTMPVPRRWIRLYAFLFTEPPYCETCWSVLLPDA